MKRDSLSTAERRFYGLCWWLGVIPFSYFFFLVVAVALGFDPWYSLWAMGAAGIGGFVQFSFAFALREDVRIIHSATIRAWVERLFG